MSAAPIPDQAPQLDRRYQWHRDPADPRWWIRDVPPGDPGISDAEPTAEPYWDDYDIPSVTGW